VLPTVVCAVLSLLVHVTLPPAGIVTGLGAYAVEVSRDAPATMDTGVPPPPVDGVVGVIGVEYEEPQPEHSNRSGAASSRRTDGI
jgi:hypothetical protein